MSYYFAIIAGIQMSILFFCDSLDGHDSIQDAVCSLELAFLKVVNLLFFHVHSLSPQIFVGEKGGTRGGKRHKNRVKIL